MRWWNGFSACSKFELIVLYIIYWQENSTYNIPCPIFVCRSASISNWIGVFLPLKIFTFNWFLNIKFLSCLQDLSFGVFVHLYLFVSSSWSKINRKRTRYWFETNCFPVFLATKLFWLTKSCRWFWNQSSQVGISPGMRFPMDVGRKTVNTAPVKRRDNCSHPYLFRNIHISGHIAVVCFMPRLLYHPFADSYTVICSMILCSSLFSILQEFTTTGKKIVLGHY